MPPIATAGRFTPWTLLAPLAAAAVLTGPAPARADWSAHVNFSNYDGLMVGTAIGSHTWTTVREGWGASYNTAPSLTRNFQYQAWSGSSWPSDSFGGRLDLPVGGSATASWTHDVSTDELAWYSAATVTGPLANGQSAGAFLLYEFNLVVAPFSSVEVQFLDGYGSVDLSHGANDRGTAFAGLKLYSIDVDLNAAGGANRPYFGNQQRLAGGAAEGSLAADLGLMSYTFGNATAQARSYALRLEASALVFTTPVPEPQTWALWLVGLAGLAGLGLLAGKARPTGLPSRRPERRHGA